MPDHSSDVNVLFSDRDSRAAGDPAAVDAQPAAQPESRASRRAAAAHEQRPAPQHRTDWRLGGRTVARWRERLLAIAFASLGVGILAGTFLAWLWQSPWAPASATALLWVGMLVPIVLAFARSKPIGLLRFRGLDVLYGVALGGLLRMAQGWIEVATGGTGALPSYTLVGGDLPGGWLFTDVVAVVAIAPVIEEFFFRGVILVALYTVLRRPFGHVVAGLVAVVVSTGLFVVVHGLVGGVSVDQLLSLTLLGLVCGLLVALTGRIWAAVLVHVFYNAAFVALALLGTYFA